MQVVLLPVYYPSEEEANNPQLFAANVRALMARELGASLSDHGEHFGVSFWDAH
jgi:lysophosphatidylcholine acyltransferase / lyso-PAF acetyltransferase